eukprot:6202040-Pleurochrysis_carterae.AAC.2
MLFPKHGTDDDLVVPGSTKMAPPVAAVILLREGVLEAVALVRAAAAVEPLGTHARAVAVEAAAVRVAAGAAVRRERAEDLRLWRHDQAGGAPRRKEEPRHFSTDQ